MFGINKEKTEFVSSLVRDFERGLHVGATFSQGLVHLGKVITVIGTVGAKVCTNVRLKDQVSESISNIASVAFDEIAPITEVLEKTLEPEMEVLQSEEFQNDLKTVNKLFRPLFK